MRVWLTSSTTLLTSCPTSRPSPGTSRTKRNITSVPGCQRLGSSASSLEQAVEILWNLIIQGNHLPDNGRPEHLMWCLHFLKVYPKQGPGCTTVGGSERGAVDPRTHQKLVWKFIKAVTELVNIVARIFVFFSYCVAIIVVEMHVVFNGNVYHRHPHCH
jgi:hypothetical protein